MKIPIHYQFFHIMFNAHVCVFLLFCTAKKPKQIERNKKSIERKKKKQQKCSNGKCGKRDRKREKTPSR